MICTANGILKKTALLAYSNPRSVGVRAINIDEGDRLVDVAITDGDQEVFIATRKGLSSRFSEKGVRTIGRVGRGVIGIRLNADDYVVGMQILSGKGYILTLTENGFGKKTSVSDYRLGNRGNKGVFTIKTSSRNGDVVGILQVQKDVEVMIITQLGKLIRMNLNKLRAIGRVTQGVKLIQMDESEHVVAFTRIEDNNNEPHANGSSNPAGKNGTPPKTLN